jgi:hypothetical protein
MLICSSEPSIAMSFIAKAECPNVVGVKRRENETVYFLSDNSIHVVPVGFQAECVNGKYLNFPVPPEFPRSLTDKPEK